MTFSKGQTITYKATGEVNTIIKNSKVIKNYFVKRMLKSL